MLDFCNSTVDHNMWKHSRTSHSFMKSHDKIEADQPYNIKLGKIENDQETLSCEEGWPLFQ